MIRPDSMLDEIAEDKEAEDQEIGGIQSSNRRQYRQPRIKNDIFSSRDRKDKGELNINIQGGNLQPSIQQIQKPQRLKQQINKVKPPLS